MTPAALAYPMHGQHKLSNEGYRTRDGHIIEWLGRFSAAAGSHIDVISRPEPVMLAAFRRVRGSVAAGTVPLQTQTWRVPNIDPKHWWVRSAGAYPKVAPFGGAPAVTWNPFTATAPANRNPFNGDRTVVLDLLDDWTIHYGFASIRKDVERAYQRAFEASSAVFANSEGTLALAHRFGRSDARLMTNGVDSERFGLEPNARGPLTIGYVGKIGKRLDAQLMSDVCQAFPDLRFVFAGPFLDPHDTYRPLLSRYPNVELLGDVHYDDVPALMATFDLGWVPHAVGDGEVGGDVIKTYEYRATGLQVLTTPVIGAGRALTEGVHIVQASEQVEWLREAVSGRERLDRVPANIPAELTWRHKAQCIAQALGFEVAR
jgi:glycosyltransferase involved in cell wall biosynthesis